LAPTQALCRLRRSQQPPRLSRRALQARSVVLNVCPHTLTALNAVHALSLSHGGAELLHAHQVGSPAHEPRHLLLDPELVKLIDRQMRREKEAIEEGGLLFKKQSMPRECRRQRSLDVVAQWTTCGSETTRACPPCAT